MVPKQANKTIISLFVVTVLVMGGLVNLPNIQTVEAAVNIGQSKSQVNTCALFFVQVICTNNADNTATVSPTPVATQDIDVTGTQNIDQTNACDDDDGSECLNEAGSPFSFFNLRNSFSLAHDQAADVSVESFEQDIRQQNDCVIFDFCINSGGNRFAIQAEDDDGTLATGTDVNVDSSVQDVNQLNDCDGNAGIGQPKPNCGNLGVNGLDLFAIGDGDIDLRQSSQLVEQENNCDNGKRCRNSGLEFGLNLLRVTSGGPNTEVNLDTNTQQASQGNECSGIGQFCDNSVLNARYSGCIWDCGN